MAYYNNSIQWISLLYPQLTWRKETTEKVIYLTFDDGPIPGVTDFVLQQLQSFDAKGTFFCVGDNVSKHPEVFRKIVAEGHRYGNHTFNHLKGWNTKDDVYFDNVKKCDDAFEAVLQGSDMLNGDKLFRPPYGKISKSQVRYLKGDFKIIMWSVLTGDFDARQSAEECLKTSIKHTGNGSIVIFHDSVKAEKNLRYALPRFLEYFSERGFQFNTL